MYKKSKILTFITVSLFLLFFLFSIAWTEFKNKKLEQRIDNLEKIVSQQKLENSSWEETNNGPELSEKKSFVKEIENQVSSFFEEKGETINLENLFSDKNEIKNINSSTSISNSTILNGVKFSYNFVIKNQELKGIVTSDNQEKLQELKQKLKKLNISIISSDSSQIEFEADKNSVKEVLEIFNIKSN